MIVLRPLTRIVATLLLVALAAAGIVIAVFCIQGGRTGLSLPALARHVSLPSLRATVGDFLAHLEGPGGVDVLAVLAGLGVALLGLLLLAGLLVPRRERLVVLEDDAALGRLDGRRRAVALAATSLADDVDGVTQARVRMRLGRRRGGRLTVRVTHPHTASGDVVERAVTAGLDRLAPGGPITSRVVARVGDRGRRVQ